MGVPTVTERLLQQAVSQVLMPKYENEFSKNSYGFRPNKNARQAVGKALEYIHEGYTNIVDIDLKSFFDEVDHCLLNILYLKVKCPITLKLIRQWLRAPIKINGKLQKRRIAQHSRIPLKKQLQMSKRRSTRKSDWSAALLHLTQRVRQRTDTTKTSFCSLSRRFQHLLQTTQRCNSHTKSGRKVPANKT